jgi:hypothetical protein
MQNVPRGRLSRSHEEYFEKKSSPERVVTQDLLEIAHVVLAGAGRVRSVCGMAGIDVRLARARWLFSGTAEAVSFPRIGSSTRLSCEKVYLLQSTSPRNCLERILTATYVYVLPVRTKISPAQAQTHHSSLLCFEYLKYPVPGSSSFVPVLPGSFIWRTSHATYICTSY